jgi:hypothetical protein
MQSLYMRETVLAPEAGLKASKRWRDLHHVMIKSAYFSKDRDALTCVCILHCRGE